MSIITNVAARIRDTLTGRTDQPDKAWEKAEREQAKAEVRHPTPNAHIERLAEIQNDPTMQGYLDRPSRGVERTRSAFEARNPDTHALINKIAAIANDRAMDGPAADRAINTLMTEHQRQKLGIIDRGDVYGITVRDQRGERASDLTHARDLDRAVARKRQTIRSAGKTRDDRDFGHGD